MRMQVAETESLGNVNGRVPRDKGMGGSFEVLPLVQIQNQRASRKGKYF